MLIVWVFFKDRLFAVNQYLIYTYYLIIYSCKEVFNIPMVNEKTSIMGKHNWI